MRRRRASVELFEEIRREYEFGVGTIQGVARKFGVHRRMVREALAGAVPIEKPPVERRRPQLEPVVDFIEGILEADRKAPRKQRHTAHRIYVRLGKERPECRGGRVDGASVRPRAQARPRDAGRREVRAPELPVGQ